VLTSLGRRFARVYKGSEARVEPPPLQVEATPAVEAPPPVPSDPAPATPPPLPAGKA
jgi:alanine racemase